MEDFFPNVKTNTLIRDDEGYWSISSTAGTICDNCGIKPICAIREEAVAGRSWSEATRKVEITACRAYRPVLGFSVLEGLGLPEWNTFRITGSWQKRLNVDELVAIADIKNHKLVRTMKIEYIDCAPLSVMLAIYAHENHAVLYRQRMQETRGLDPEAMLFKILRNAYGSRCTLNRLFTVIGMVPA